VYEVVLSSYCWLIAVTLWFDLWENGASASRFIGGFLRREVRIGVRTWR